MIKEEKHPSGRRSQEVGGRDKGRFLSKNIRVIRHDDRFKAYLHELINLMPWLGPHIAKHIDQGSALQMVKCTMPTVTIKCGYSSGNMMNDRMKFYTPY